MGGAIPDIAPPPWPDMEATAREAAFADMEFPELDVRSVGDGKGCWVFWVDEKGGKLAC
jgi:hypothetical protein